MNLEKLGDTRAGVFFDLEKTFTADAVEQVAALSMWRKGDLRPTDIARVLWCYFRYNLGILKNFDTLKQEGAVVFRGRRPEEDESHYQTLFEERLVQRVHPEAIQIAEQARELGYLLVFVSSTYRFMVQPFAKRFGFDTVFGCDLEVEDGRCTGKLTGTIYHQEKKAVCLDAIAEEHGLELSRSYAFGDSVNDAPMLSRVGHGIAVNPSRGLQKLATEQGWTIVHW
jgi:HAD superfamily hydrolase (TIGR01490 family)